MSNWKPLVTHVLALAVGAAGMWQIPHWIDNWQAREPVRVVQSYLQSQSSGHILEALQYLSGEAKQIVGQTRTVQPDPVQKVSVELASRSGNVAQVRAGWVSGNEENTEDFYLANVGGTWKIFSVQLPTPDWTSMGRANLKPEQRQVIDEYTQAIAQGDVQKAMGYLVGPARIRASRVVLSLIKQDIRVTNVTSVGSLPGGKALIMADETIQGQQKEAQTVLYTLAQVGGQWKIDDIRLVDRHAP
ncbi:MAG TPA: hypothetical protein GX517_12395 [Alicyclobacillus sp.]|nr:hypothetical protein [Alicyclobacillus sp.]